MPPKRIDRRGDRGAHLVFFADVALAAPAPRPPAASTAAAAVWMVPGSFGLATADLAAIATLAPSRAARSAIARPMPREAPVMNRVLPRRAGHARLRMREPEV